MSDHEHTSKDLTISLTETSASGCLSSLPRVSDSLPKQLHPHSESLAGSNSSNSDSEWNLIDPALPPHPAVTNSPGHQLADVEPPTLLSPSKSASPASPITTQVKPTSHQLSGLKRSASPVSAFQAHTTTQPTASQIARRNKLDKRLFYLPETEAAEDNSDSDSHQSSCGSASPCLDMTDSSRTVRKELAHNFMFMDRRHFHDSEDTNFKEKVMRVMKSDRHSDVSGRDAKHFKENLGAYKNDNEHTLVQAILPIMMKEDFSAQDVNERGEVEGDQKERSFIEAGVKYQVDQLFNSRYCLPHQFMNVIPLVESKVHQHFDSKKYMTTPKPDYLYGLHRPELSAPPPDILLSDGLDALLDIAGVRNAFLVWENKSGQGDLIKCGNDALKDASALILARRKLYALKGRAPKPGIDKETYMYTAINNNQKIEFYVAYAWAPEELDRVEFCMEMIGSEDFTHDEDMPAHTILTSVRKVLHNIIEWGSVKRIPELQQFYQELYAAERARFKASVKESEEAKAEAGQSNKKQKTTH
ncbi:MAG: hypothetical protein Q9180_004205 [Flavoplaca navasiana]